MDSTVPTIGLLADPGAPERVATRITEGVAERISQQLDERWTVEVSPETLPLSPDGTIQLTEHASELRRRHGWDVIVYLSDLPRYVDDQPMLAEVSADQRTALIAMPVLGSFRVRARTRDLVLSLVTEILRNDISDESSVEHAIGRSDVWVHQASASSDAVRLVLAGGYRRLQVLGGMVRSNRPGRLLHALTGCIAAAVAAGAFGIFYGSLTSVADSLSLGRLALISLLVMSVLTAWLILRNKLWNTGGHQDEIWRKGLDNTSTVITVGVSVLLLYLGLVAALLALAASVLTPGYLQSELQHPIGFLEYLKVAWLSASMATMAGALGANFDSDDSVRQATFSRRYHERRKLFDAYQDQEDQG